MKRLFAFCLIFVSIITYSQKLKEIRSIESPNEINKDLRILNPIPERERVSNDKSIAFNGFNFGLSKAMSNFKILATDKDGLPIAIEGKELNKDVNRNLSIENRSILYLESLTSLMKITDVKNEFKILRITNDESNNQHIRMQQTWNDIPVYGAEIILHTEEGDINFMNGRYNVKPAQLLTAKTLTELQSSDICYADLGSKKENFTLANVTIESNKQEFVYYKYNDEFRLVYHHTIYKNIIERWEYFIDANSGEILKKYPSICKFHNHKSDHKCGFSDEQKEVVKENNSQVNEFNGPLLDGATTANAQDLFGVNRLLNTYQVGSKFYLIDGARPMFNLSGSTLPNDPVGSIWTINASNTSPQNDNFSYDHVSSNNNSWSNKTAVSAHYNGGIAYEYFKNLHSRNSINGSGGNIISLINIADENGSSMGNAFWNGQAMFYGNGDSDFKELARGLDVAGHEMTHGVVQSTANLEYEGESGALNESFADVFGVMIDREDWLIGEDVVKTSAFPSGALRSMSDPHNGGSSLNSPGWQPKKYSERYTGSEDNGGVHINSGITNHAFFLFASNANVGKDKAEKVYYKALSDYLTKSSQFIDARIAIVKAAQDLYGGTAATAAGQAFDAVGIGAGQGGSYEEDVDVNPGTEMILFTTDEQQGLYIYTPGGQSIANPLSQKNPISKPSMTDDGSVIVFVGDDNKIQFVTIDWGAGTFSEGTFNIPNTTWRSAAISKDGTKISGLKATTDNEIWVFDLISGLGKNYELKNPTFSQGVSTGDVLYADVMEWDFSGEYIMYDANNKLSGVNGDIEYWDIGFIRVWDNDNDDFVLEEEIEKLFPSLDQGITIGNPTFSKNSPYIIAFDYIEEGFFDNTYAILGANIEAGEVGAIIDENTGLGYPSYSTKDNFLVYNRDDDFGTGSSLSITGLDATKVQGNNNDNLYGDDLYWGVWFSNGQRELTSLIDINKSIENVTVIPNPTTDKIRLDLENLESNNIEYTITNLIGQLVMKNSIRKSNNTEIDIQHLKSGTYIININIDGKNSQVSKFVKL